ncbi:MAG TPA: glycosyltransferase family 4 protein [Acidimicrobiales bacterium]|nr:glycosyltransferase family 4 protein [Acidimicrobiales bacterium]
MKVAYVTVRYGKAVLGGAEQACRQLAEHLAADGADISVHTTCALDATTWDDVLPPGEAHEAGVRVHRHRSTSGRDPGFDAFSGPVLADPAAATTARQEEWLRRQGPVCPAAVESALASGADIVVATPYLYWPTVDVARRSPPGSLVLHPAAHDEPPVHLPLFAGVFGAATGLAFYTDAERRLVERLFPCLSARSQAVVGIGVDLRPESDPVRFRASAGMGERPYLLCLGRVDEGKGTAVLARFFATYKRRRPGPLALVFAGPVVHPPPAHPDVITTGAVTEEEKWSALAGAVALVNPSVNESFSIVALESWAAGRPVLVNARCGPTAEHARRSRGGLAFAGYAAFEAAVDRLVEDPRAAAALGAAGRAYVERSFAWPVVTARYRAWLERVVTARHGAVG